MNYGRRFYYFAIATDFTLRYVYFFFLFNVGDSKSFFNLFQGMFAASALLEILRRALWSLIRVENE